MRSALRQLCKHGIEALRPQKVNDKWRKPKISRRVANDLRKLSIRNGTYGQFNSETGEGWNPLWDAPERKAKEREAFHTVLKNAAEAQDNNNNVDTDEKTFFKTIEVDDLLNMNNAGSNKGSISSIRPPKLHKRERTRESRAQNIEGLLEQADDKIEEYRLEKEKKRNEGKDGIENEFKRISQASTW